MLRAPIGAPLAAALSRLPTRISDAVARFVRRRTVGDLTAYGLPVPAEGVFSRLRRLHVAPMIVDPEVLDAIRAGRIEIVAGVDALDDTGVLLADGERIAPDTVIAATGYRTGLEPLVGHLGVLDDHGSPRMTDGEAAPGLRFVGFVPRPALLHAFGREARARGACDVATHRDLQSVLSVWTIEHGWATSRHRRAARAGRKLDDMFSTPRIQPGQTVENPVTGERFTFTHTAASTDGELLAFDFALRPGGSVPIPHVHPVQTERFEVTAGTMRFRVGLRTRRSPSRATSSRWSPASCTPSPTAARRRRGCASRCAPRWRWRRCSPTSSRWPRPAA